MMNKENIVEKWASCKYSLNFGIFAGDEAGYEMKDKGYNENYGCEHPDIVTSEHFPVTSFPEKGKATNVAVLHGMGKFDDPEVVRTLKETCGKCPFFKKNTS